MNWPLLQNSLLVSTGATALAVALGLAVGLWASTLAARARNGVLALCVIALALPPFLVTNCWLHFFGGAGVWRGLLPWNLMSLPGAVWLLALLYWPLTTLLVVAVWRRLETEWLEVEPAARGWALLRFVLLPLARPALAPAAVMTLVLALNNFTVPALLQVKVFPAEVWVRFSTELDSWGALGLAWPLVLAPCLLLWWLARRTFAWSWQGGAASAERLRRQLGPGWCMGTGAFASVVLMLSVGLPVFQIAASGRTWVDLPLALSAGREAAWNSFVSAAGSALLVGLVGLLLALPASGIRHPLLRIAAWLPFFIPGVILGIGWIALFNRPPFLAFYRDVGIVLLALLVRYLAVGWNAAALALRQTDADLNDAARMEGASLWQTLRLVWWPQIAGTVLAAGYAVYLLCLWDVESLVLIAPPGGETLASRVFNLLHYGHNAQVNALCLMLLTLAVLPLAAWLAVRLVRRAVAGSHLNLELGAGFISCAAVLALLLTGCRPGGSANTARLESKFFDRAEVWGTRGTAPGQFNKPRSVALDGADNLYVADMTGRVQKLAPDGRFLLQWQMPQTDLGKPKGLTRDPRSGNMIVVEPHYQRLNYFTPEGRLVAQWGVSGTNAGQLRMPRGVAVNSRGEIFIPEYSVVERVQRFTGTNGIFLNGWGHAGTAPGEFNRPEGIAVDAQDRVYVADSCNHRIQVFERDGKFIRQFGRPGSGRGELSYPYDVCVDAAGRVYVCEFGNSRIQVFDDAGQSLEIIGGAGSEPGQFNNPWGVALDSQGNLYVADALNHRVQKLLRRAHVALVAPHAPTPRGRAS